MPTIKNKSKSAPCSYAALVALFPLRPMHDEVDYDNALETADALVGSANLNEDQQDYLVVLTDIIQKYEAGRHPIAGGGSPLDTLISCNRNAIVSRVA